MFLAVFRHFQKLARPLQSLKQAWGIRQNRKVQEDKMIKFEKSEMQRLVVSAIGAVTVSATCIGAAIAPAKAAERAPMSVAAWQDRVENRIGSIYEGETVYEPERLVASTVAVNFTADGDFAGVRLAKSSGEKLVDTRALRIARTIRYPAMPEGFRGERTQVRMTLYFGPEAEAAVAQEKKKSSENIQLAAL
jgi:TonB family protein